MSSAVFTQLQSQDAARRLQAWFGPAAGVSVSPIGLHLPIYPEEEAQMTRAVPKRREEFSTGRWCARQALAQLGVEPVALPVGPWRNPVWPDGVTGSISHTAKACAAVVAPCTAWNAIGIDLLDRDAGAALPPDSGRLVTNAADDVHALAAPEWVPPLALLFSAKEAAIKAVSPVVQRFVDFTEIRLRFDGDAFTAALGDADLRIAGWWAAVADELIVTGAALG